VLLAQSREAPFELTGLTVAPGEFPQVRQQGDGLVVPRGHLGADQLPGSYATAINDNGQIVANGSDATTGQAALLLTPP
jgi:hypothetical protein